MKGKHFTAVVGTVLGSILLSGCYRPVREPVIISWPQTEPVVHSIIVGRSLEHRPIECLVIGQGSDVTFILAAIHGDEPAGVPLVRRLAVHLQQHRQLLAGRKVVLVPVANPDGLAHNRRLNANGVDLNRNFSTANRTNSSRYGLSSVCEPEARVIEQLIRQYDPARIVSIHQLTDTGPEALSGRFPKGCIDYDGPARRLAGHMAQYCDLPVEKLGSRPGSLGSYAGLTLGIGCITVEIPLNAELLGPQLLWQQYGQALVAAVVYPEPVE